MDTLVFEENYVIAVVPTITDNAAPTVAQIAAGDIISTYVAKDGFQPNVTNNRVTSGNIATKFNAQRMGSWSSELALKGNKDSVADDMWDLLTPGFEGYVVVGWTGSLAATSPCYVIPIETGQRELPASAENELQTFVIPCAVTSEPNFDAVVAA